MTETEMKTTLSALTGETDDVILLAFLHMAAQKVLAKCYPFGTEETTVPLRYQSVQLEIAMYLLNKRGAEGELSHNENGINRSYEAASVPDSMLKSVIPFASVFQTGGGS